MGFDVHHETVEELIALRSRKVQMLTSEPVATQCPFAIGCGKGNWKQCDVQPPKIPLCLFAIKS